MKIFLYPLRLPGCNSIWKFLVLPSNSKITNMHSISKNLHHQNLNINGDIVTEYYHNQVLIGTGASPTPLVNAIRQVFGYLAEGKLRQVWHIIDIRKNLVLVQTAWWSWLSENFWGVIAVTSDALYDAIRALWIRWCDSPSSDAASEWNLTDFLGLKGLRGCNLIPISFRTVTANIIYWGSRVIHLFGGDLRIVLCEKVEFNFACLTTTQFPTPFCWSTLIQVLWQQFALHPTTLWRWMAEVCIKGRFLYPFYYQREVKQDQPSEKLRADEWRRYFGPFSERASNKPNTFVTK